MTENKKTVDLNLVELVNLAANILNQLFIKAPKDKAKTNFKDIKKGKPLELGSITIAETIKSDLKLTLDYSEFVGPGFNFDTFAAALQSILRQISEKFKAKADLNVMTSEQGSVLIHLPGLIEKDGQLNAMVLAFDLSNQQAVSIQLMFVNPAQYEDLIRTNEGSQG